MSANLSIMKQLRVTRDEQRATIELLHRTVADLRESKAVLVKENKRLQAQYDDMFRRVVEVSDKMEAQLNKPVPVDALGWPKQ